MTGNLFNRIRALPLFKSFPEEFIHTFAGMAQVRNATAGNTILVEGQTNDALYILLKGEVEVRVEGERVAVLVTPGDLMGEISMLTSRPITASLISFSDVEYVALPMTELDAQIIQSPNGFGYQLYRVLASVLSEKIIKTNQQARRFEIANRDLMEAKSKLEEANQTLDQKVKDRTKELQASNVELESRNTELLLSHRKLEELYSSKDMTFKKLSQLQTMHLTPLANTLTDLEGLVDVSQKVRIQRAKDQLDGSIEMLRPMSELYSTEQAIRSRKILLAESDRKQQIMTKLALGGSGAQLEIASSVEEAIAMLDAGTRFDLAFITTQLGKLIPELKKRLPDCKVALMASSNVPTELPALREYGDVISNIVSRHPEDRTFTVKNVATTASKLVSKDYFGLEKYMIWGVEVQGRKVERSTQRAELIDDMKSHFANLGVRTTISERAAVVTEELLMNAIYDAPHDANGKPMFNHLDRTSLVELAPDQQSELRYACDGMLAAVSVTDPFGGFRVKILLNYLERNYASQGSVQEQGKGGAGRGLHQIIENSDLVVFNVHRNLRTEVIALFNLDAKMVVEGAKPSFHFFFQ